MSELEDGILRTKGIEIVDADGNPRAFFGLDAYGEPSLYMLDSKQHPRLQLKLVDTGQANIAISDESGKDIIGAFVDHDGTGEIFIKDGRGIPCASIVVKPDGTATLSLPEEDTKQVASFRLFADGFYKMSDDQIAKAPTLRLVSSKKKDDDKE